MSQKLLTVQVQGRSSGQLQEQLLARLTELEDMLFGQQATAAVSRSPMVGSETFVATLTQLANSET